MTIQTTTSARKARPDYPELQRRRLHTSGLELRAQTGSAVLLEGYASVTDEVYEVAGGPPYGWNETIDAGAFDETLSDDPDVVLLLNHEGAPMARTKSGTLDLEADDTGLAVSASLDTRDPDVAALLPKLERGDVDEMSFAFRVTADTWDEAWENREIHSVNLNRGDVSVVTFGANAATSVALRGLEETLEALSQNALEADLAEVRSIDGLDGLLGNAEAAVAHIRSLVQPDGMSGRDGMSHDLEAKRRLADWTARRYRTRS